MDTVLMVIVNNVLAIIHLAAVDSIPLVYYLFIIALTNEGKQTPIKKKLFAFTVYGFYLLSIFTSPFTHFIMYFDKTGVYCHGPFYPITYFIVIIYIFAGILELIIHSKKITRRQFYLVLSYTIIDIAAALYQFRHIEVLLLGFYSAISLLVISFVLKNPLELMDSNMGTFNRAAFKEFIFSRSSKRVLLIVHINNANSIKYIYGLDNGYNIIRNCISHLLEECHQKLCFYIFSNTFVFACKSEEDAKYKMDIINKYKTTPLNLTFKNNESVSSSVLIDSNCFIIRDSGLIQKSFNDNSQTNSLDHVLGILQFLLESLGSSSEIVNIDEEFIKVYKEKLRVQKIVDDAIASESFEVYLQPIFDLKKKKFTGAESLIRLRDPEGKMISPALFIPETEKNGKILELGDISIKKTCEFIQKGKLLELGIEKVNINLSMVQCMQENIVEHIISLLNNYDIPKSMIRFEITESITASNPEKLQQVMNQLNSYGIEFALDDYGTGYSNTSRLLNFPFSEIKFDKSFVDSAMESNRNKLPLKHLMNMVNDSNMIVLVEGIETKEMSDLIEEFGGSLIQGFYYAKPLPLDDFVSFIKNNN